MPEVIDSDIQRVFGSVDEVGQMLGKLGTEAGASGLEEDLDSGSRESGWS
jgi:hypothetical protein